MNIPFFFKTTCPSHKEDMGLGRNFLLTIVYSFFLSLLVVATNTDTYLPLIPMGMGIVYLWIRYRWRPRKWILFFLTPLCFGFILPLFYVVIGKIDSALAPARFDSLLSSVDMMIFQMPVADWILEILSHLKEPLWPWYDIMITFYFCYYILPVFGGFSLIKTLPEKDYHFISAYNSSILIFFIINFLCYLIVPVSGPQYHLDFKNPLPLGEWGNLLYHIVRQGQTTYIDCFPSGHFGIGLLVSFWLAPYSKAAFITSLIITMGILGATLGLRYHYTMDLLFSFPLAWISYKAGRRFCPS